MNMNINLIRKLSVILSTLAAIVVNGLAVALPLNGQNTGAISDQFKVFFVPAGYVFSIWGIIYIGMIAFSIFQLLPSQANNPRLQAAGWWFTLSSIANGTWIFLWHYNQFPATLVVMAILLVSLIMVYLNLGVGVQKVSAAERWAAWLPVSIYLAWVSVATIANATEVFDYLGWKGAPLDPQVWAVIMLAVALVVGLLMAARHGDSAYLGVFVWSFIGIAVKQAGYPLVANAAWVAAGAALLLALAAPFLNRQKLALQPVDRAK